MAAPRHVCAFCSADLADVELLFRSPIGGLPPSVCSDCVEDFGRVLALHRADPGMAAIAVAEHNARVGG